MRKINKWLYSNLNSAPEKRHQQQIVAAIMGFPANVFERYPAAIENDKLPRTREELLLMMQADGFPEWTADQFHEMPWNRIWIASNWTKLQMLRIIAESDWDGAVISTDRGFPVVPFKEIEEKVAQCPRDLRSLFLHWIIEPWEGHFTADHYKSLAVMQPSGIDGILKNFCANGSIAYFTSQGAQHFLDIWKKIPFIDFQAVLTYEFIVSSKLQTGFYATNPHLALTIPAILEINRNEDILTTTITSLEHNPVHSKDKLWEIEREPDPNLLRRLRRV